MKKLMASGVLIRIGRIALVALMVGLVYLQCGNDKVDAVEDVVIVRGDLVEHVIAEEDGADDWEDEDWDEEDWDDEADWEEEDWDEEADLEEEDWIEEDGTDAGDGTGWEDEDWDEEDWDEEADWEEEDWDEEDWSEEEDETIVGEDEDWEEEEDAPVTDGDVVMTDIYGERILAFHVPAGLTYYPDYSEPGSYYNLLDDSEELDFYIENSFEEDYKKLYESGQYSLDDNDEYDINVMEVGTAFNGSKAYAIEFGYRDEDDGSFEYDFNYIIFAYKDSRGRNDYVTVEFNSGAEEYSKGDYEALFRKLFK